MKNKTNIAIILTLSLLVHIFTPAIRAEETGSSLPDAIRQKALELQQSAQGSGSSGTIQLDPESQMLLQQMQAQQAAPSSDRANKNGAAKATAIVGATMALLSCAMLMEKAMEEPDPATKAMLENMAMQQCSQGAKDIGNAADNGDNKNQLTQDNSPKMAQLKSGTNNGPSSSKDSASPLPTMGSGADAKSKTSESGAGALPEEQKARKRPDGQEEGLTASSGHEPDAFTVPNEIDSAKLKFEDNPKANNGSDGSSNRFASFLGGTITSRTAGLEADSQNKAAEAERGASKKLGEQDGGAGSAQGDDSISHSDSPGSSKSGNNDMLSGMLNQILTGPPAGVAGLGNLASGGTMNSPGTVKGKPSVNIFQYANKCYRQLNSGRRLKIKRNIYKATLPGSLIAEAAKPK